MIKAVIFDFRDTLIRVDKSYQKSNDLLYKVVAGELKRRGKKLSRKEFDDKFARVVKAVLAKYGGNKNIHDWSGLFLRRLLISLNLLVSYGDIQKLLKKYHMEFAAHARLYPEARGVLERLHRQKIKLGIVIDGTDFRERLTLRHLKLTRYFSSIVISENVGKNKFTAEPLKRVVRELKLPARQIAVVGDRIDKDIIHANRLGCFSIKLERKAGRYTKHAAKKKIETPDKIINNLKELAWLTK